MLNEKQQKVVYENPLLPFRIWQEHRNNTAKGIWHYHHETEIIAMLKGNFRISTKSEMFNMHPGSIVIIGSYEPHHTFQEDPYIEYIVFQFDIFKYLVNELINLRHFTEVGRLFTQLNYIFKENIEMEAQLFKYINEILKEYKDREKGYEIALYSLIYKVVLSLLRSDYKSVLDINYSAEFLRILPALDYIEENIYEKISMEKVCACVNMSYFHFCRCFKKSIGRNFKDYINYKKILQAEQLLLKSNLSVLEIAESIGMQNKGNFYKIFHSKNHCTPSEFRKKFYSSEK